MSISQLLSSGIQDLSIALSSRPASTPFAQPGSGKICVTVDDLVKDGDRQFVSRADMERAQLVYTLNSSQQGGVIVDNRFFNVHPETGPQKKKRVFFNVDIPKTFKSEKQDSYDEVDEDEAHSKTSKLGPVTVQRIEKYLKGLDGGGEDESSLSEYVSSFLSLHHVYWDEER